MINLYNLYTDNLVEKSFWDSTFAVNISDKEVSEYIIILSNIKYFSDKIDELVNSLKSPSKIKIPLDDSGKIFCINYPVESIGIIQVKINGLFTNIDTSQDKLYYIHIKDDYSLEFEDYEFIYSKRCKEYRRILKLLL